MTSGSTLISTWWCGLLTGGGQDVVDEDEDRFLRAQLDAFADHVHELTHRQVRGHKIPEGGAIDQHITA